MQRKLVGPRRSFAAPERNRWRCAVGIFHHHASRVRRDAANAPRRVAEQHDVAGIALDREVLVNGADDDFFRLRDDGKHRRIGDGAAAGDGGQTRSATRAQTTVDHVAEEIRSIAAALRSDSLREHLQNAVVLLALQVAIGIGAAHAVEERVFVPILAGAHGNDLLRQDVERRVGNVQDIEIALANGANGGGAFQQVVARGGEEAAFGDGSTPVTGAAHALQCDSDGARRVDLADKVDGANVDAKLERCGRDQQANLAVLQLALGVEAQLAREAAVMGGDLVFADALAKMMATRSASRARVDEHQRGAMLQREFGKAVVDLAPHFVGGDGTEFGARDFDGEIELAAMADVDDGREQDDRRR